MSKFLVLGKPAGTTPSSNSPEFGEMLQGLQSEFEYQLELRKKGKIIAGGPFLDKRGGCYILEAASVEELGEILTNSPGNPWMDLEVHPLGSIEDNLTIIKKSSGHKQK